MICIMESFCEFGSGTRSGRPNILLDGDLDVFHGERLNYEKPGSPFEEVSGVLYLI